MYNFFLPNSCELCSDLSGSYFQRGAGQGRSSNMSYSDPIEARNDSPQKLYKSSKIRNFYQLMTFRVVLALLDAKQFKN